jgi:carboxyl-terminal processing protease
MKDDSSRPEFKTNGGRTVFGGGGITPDYIIPAEKLTAYTRNLLRNNVFYQFVLNYIDNNGDQITEKYGDSLLKFKEDFSFTDADLTSFLKFADDKKVEVIDEDFDKDKEYILTRLKAQIARNYWKNEGWYNVLLEIDKQFLKSITLFTEAKDLAKLK